MDLDFIKFRNVVLLGHEFSKRVRELLVMQTCERHVGCSQKLLWARVRRKKNLLVEAIG
jgi:hypothetical protein